MLGALFTLLLLYHSHHVVAEPGIFYNPPTGGPIHDYSDNQVYELGDTVQMRWTTSLDHFSIMLWQNDNQEYEWIQTNLTGVTSYDWIVSTQRNLSDGNIFFFQIRDATDLYNSNRLFASHYFNITKDDSKPTTSSSPSKTTTSSPSQTIPVTPTIPLTTSSITTTDPIPTTEPTSTPSPQNSDSPTTNDTGLSPQTKIGVGVGVGLGCAFLAAIALIIWSFYRRNSRLRDKEQNFDAPPAYMATGVPDFSKGFVPIQSRHQQGPPAEVHGETRQTVPAEVHGETRQTVRYELQ